MKKQERTYLMIGFIVAVMLILKILFLMMIK